MRILLAGLIIAATVLVLAPGDAGAAAAVHVKWLNCALHPGQLDIVYIENTGDTAQDLTGWELRSDGENERMSLTPVGTIAPGQEIFATAGAHAVNLPDEDVFLWSNNEMLRDSGDPPDYALLLDSAGNQMSGMDCNHNVLAAPTAAPTEAPAPTAEPTAAPTPEAAVRPVSSNPGAGGGSRTATSSGPGRVSSGPGAEPDSIPVGGGPPGIGGNNASAWLIAGALLAVAGIAMTSAALGVRSAAIVPGEERSRGCAK